ncbi:MAG TPA: ATP-binding protein [Myxococcota bacterium]|jgi:signal transduction histidine kinase
MPWRLSVGARWALRYTLAMAATLAVFAVVIQAVAQQKSDQAAALLARTQATLLLDALEAQAKLGSAAEYERWCAAQIAHRVAQADPELGLGIRLLAFDGRLRHDAGSLRGIAIVLPPDVARGRETLAVFSGEIASSGRYFVASAAAPAGFLQVAVSTRHWVKGLAALRNVMLAAFPLMLLLSGISGFLLARRSLASVDRITRVADHLSSANLHETLPVTGSGDELDRLAVTLNAMLARIRAGVEQMHRFNANAAHELRTPLHRIGSMLDATLAQPRDAAAYRDALLDLRAEVDALGGGVNALLRLAQMEAGLDPAHTGPVELAKLLRTQLEFFAPLAEARGIPLLLLEPLPEASVLGDPSWLERLFSNLLDNALKYSRPGDRVEVGVRRDGERVRIAIADSGPGIAAEDLPHLFERFARGAGHTARGGFGLGLPLAREIARAHDGSLEVESAPLGGSRFTVVLPLLAEDPARAALSGAPRRRTSQGRIRRPHEGALRRR